MKKYRNFLIAFIIFSLVFSFVPGAKAYTISPIYPQSSHFGNGVYRYYAGGVYFFANDDPASPTSNGTGETYYHMYIYDYTTSTLINDVDHSGSGIVQSWRSNGIITRWLLAPSGTSWISTHTYGVVITAYQGTPLYGNGYGVSAVMSCIINNLTTNGSYYALSEYQEAFAPITSAIPDPFNCELKTIDVNISTNFDSVSSINLAYSGNWIFGHTFVNGLLHLIYSTDVPDDTYLVGYTVHGLHDGDPVEASNSFNVVVSCNLPEPTDIQYKVVVQPNKPAIINPQSSVLYLYRSIDKGDTWSLVNTASYSCSIVVETIVEGEDENLTWFSSGGNAFRIESDIIGGSDLYRYNVGIAGLTLTGTFYINGDPNDVITTVYDSNGDVITEVQGITGIIGQIANALKNLAATLKQAFIDAFKYLFVPTSSQVQELEGSITDSSFNPFQNVSWPETSNSLTIFEGDTLGVSDDVIITIDDTGPFLIIKYAMYFVISFTMVWLIIEVL
jgi:hypothetical protein